jgi:hypothetical protein
VTVHRRASPQVSDLAEPLRTTADRAERTHMVVKWWSSGARPPATERPQRSRLRSYESLGTARSALIRSSTVDVPSTYPLCRRLVARIMSRVIRPQRSAPALSTVSRPRPPSADCPGVRHAQDRHDSPGVRAEADHEGLVRRRCSVARPQQLARPPHLGQGPAVPRRRLGRRAARKGLADSTIRTAYTVLRAILDTAVRDGAIAVNPSAAVRRPKVTRTEATHLTPAQVAELLHAARSSRYARLFELLVHTGLRRGEALALR